MMVQLKLIEKVNPSHPDKDFNSMMVQLKHQVSPATFAETEISIP